MEPNAISAAEKAERDEQLSCRFYAAQFPSVDECVIVLVKHIADMGAYVSLVEYNGIEGMILLSELSRRRIRSINKLIRVGKMEVAMVMRVDKEKGYIDLSRRRVTPEDVVACEERYQKGKAVNSIMRHVAETTGQKLEDLNNNIAWPLALSTVADKPFKTTHEAFRLAIADPDTIFSEKYGVKIDDGTKNALLKVIRRKLTPQPIRIRADLELTCFSEDGVLTIKEALLAGEDTGRMQKNLSQEKDKVEPVADDEEQKTEKPENPVSDELEQLDVIKIRLIAPPLYVLTTTSVEKAQGLENAERAIQRVKDKLNEKAGVLGKLEVKEAPRVTSSVEESQLKNLMEQMELDNQEVGGDDEEEE